MLSKIDKENRQNELQARVAARRKLIKEVGATVEASPQCSVTNIPGWFDDELFAHAQTLFDSYGVVIHISQFYGFLLSLHQPHQATILLQGGEYSTVSKMFTRNMSVIHQIQTWFAYNPFVPESKAYRLLKQIRGYHRQYAEKSDKLPNLDLQLKLSQASLNQVLFGFVGMMAVFPKELGFSNFSKYDFESMFHFWRTIGHCLGLENEFNMFAGSCEESFELCRQIFTEEWLPAINAQNELANRIGEATCLAICRFIPLTSYSGMMRYASGFMGMDKKAFPMRSFADYVSYSRQWVIMRMTSRLKMTAWASTKMMNLLVKITTSLSKYHVRRLEKLYGNKEKFIFEMDHKMEISQYRPSYEIV